MGPRLDSRGNRLNGTRCGICWTSLQWGRDLIVAETLWGAVRGTQQKLASMGPRLDSRGNYRRAAESAKDWSASMGPRLDSRGNMAGILVTDGIVTASMGPRLDSRGNSLI